MKVKLEYQKMSQSFPLRSCCSFADPRHLDAWHSPQPQSLRTRNIKAQDARLMIPNRHVNGPQKSSQIDTEMNRPSLSLRLLCYARTSTRTVSPYLAQPQQKQLRRRVAACRRLRAPAFPNSHFFGFSLSDRVVFVFPAS